ncbi:MAG: cytochrome c biogenesis protein CcsA [Deltaproteobacteria bacterium]|nr:cytochrome c biogenesis protein CcsA [Deltaproteobacteria bacterium]
MSALLFVLTALFYLAGTAGYLAYIFRQRESSARLAAWLMLLGLGLHTATLVCDWVLLGHVPAVSLRQSLSLFAWSVVAGYLLVQLKYNLRVLGSFVAPLALMLMILAFSGPAGPPRAISAFRSVWLTVHVAFAFLGNGFFAVACMAGVMYLLQERQIKSKRFGWVYSRLPSLDILDGLNRTCLMIGFPLLTAGLLTGAIYGQFLSGVYWRWAPKEVWSLITWAVYALLLHQRLTVGWQGRKAAWLAVLGFGAVVFTFLGASFIFSDYHNFSTFGQSP